MGRLVAVLCFGFVVGVFGPAHGADEKDKKDDKDAKTLQGTWAYESMDWDGKKMPFEQIKMTTMTYDGDKYTLKIGEKVTSAGTHKFDSSKSPKTFDLAISEGEGRGKVLLGIYKIDGDTITACINLSGGERPTEFKTTERSEAVLVVAKRVKK